MTMLPQNGVEYGNDEMDKEAWQCMDSVDRWCKRRKALDNTLRQGWMQLVSARYEMGPRRIGEPLFSLRPQASQTVLEISKQEDKEGAVVFDLVKSTSRRRQQGNTEPNMKESSHQSAQSDSGLRRRPIVSTAEDEKDGLQEKSQLYEDPEWEHDERPIEVPKSNLQGFGALVSPHLRSAQSTFFKALQLAVELVNIRNDALDAHENFSRLAANASNLCIKDQDHPGDE